MRLKTDRATGLTVLEAIMALTIMAILMAVFVPQFRTIQNSWASKQGTSETVQNARVLNQHLHQNLSTANKIIAVSDPSETNGYIEFQDNDGNTMRYDISADNYIEFGPVGNLANLGGPVNMLQFTCFDAVDLDTPITTVEDIRCVKVQSIVGNAAPLGNDFPLTVQAYIRTNMGGTGTDVQKVVDSEFLFDGATGEKPALCQIDATHYLCAYTGPGWDGWAAVLMIDTSNKTITKETELEFDMTKASDPVLSKESDEYYLCAYEGSGTSGTAVVLAVDATDWTISAGQSVQFDNNCHWLDLIRVGEYHHLCAYEGGTSDGWTVILKAGGDILP
jgi:competence protein ComGC